MRSIFTLSLLLGCLLCEAHAVEEITVAADPWCPYNCEADSAHPGFAIEILREALAADGIRVNYKVMPWSRALAEARHGKISGVVEATAQAASENGLRIGKEPLGYATFCLFVPAGNPLIYQEPGDLAKLQSIGLVSDYDYGQQLAPELARPQLQSQLVRISGNQTAERLIRMLQATRIHSFIDNSYVIRYTLAQMNLQHSIHSAGCAEAHPGYIAFNSVSNAAHDYTGKLDAGIQRLRANGRLAEILAHYNLGDWQVSADSE